MLLGWKRFARIVVTPATHSLSLQAVSSIIAVTGRYALRAAPFPPAIRSDSHQTHSCPSRNWLRHVYRVKCSTEPPIKAQPPPQSRHYRKASVRLTCSRTKRRLQDAAAKYGILGDPAFVNLSSPRNYAFLNSSTPS